MQAKLSQYASLSDGVKLHFTVSGAGRQTLLFVHGLGSNHKAWDKLSAQLGRHFRCISIDLPGYGQSSSGDYPYSIPFFASKINEFVRTQGYQEVILAGHSMGGQSSIAAVLEAPSLYQKLVLIAPAGFETFNAAARQWVRAMYKPALLKAMSEDQIIRNFEANFTEFPEDAQFMIDDRMKLRADEVAYDHYCRMIPKCVMGMLKAPVFERLPELTLPTLIFYGEEDQLIPNKMLNPALTTERVAKKGANRIPNSRLIMLPDCGHFVQWECAQEIAAELRAFTQQPHSI